MHAMELSWIRSVPIGPAAEAATDEEQRSIEEARRGDPRAFERLVVLHQRRVFRLAGRFFRRREDVEDVAQETFLTAWRRLATYRARAPFEHWLTRVCLNSCYDALRRRRTDRTSIDAAPEAAAEFHDPSDAVELERLLGRLPPEDRFILLLLDGEGWNVAEIADRLGWSATRVKVRAHRARHRLRRQLEQVP